jgi:hypothetical protein
VEKNMDHLLEGWGMPADRNLAANHQNLARVLARSGAEEAGLQTRSMVAEVKRLIEDENGRQAAPEAPGLDTPLQHWARVSEDYIEPGRAPGKVEFRQPIFAGIETDPSPIEGSGQHAITIHDYIDIVRRKIRRTSHVYGSRLIQEVRKHIESLAERYRAVGSEVDRVDPGSKALYAEFRSRLAALR